MDHSNEADLRVVTDEPTVEATAQDEVNLNVFFSWDELSRRLAASGQMNPPWFRPAGLDDGELLLYSPIPSKCPEDMEEDLHMRSRWEMEGAQIAKIVGPTKGLIDSILEAQNKKQSDEVAVKLVAECLMELPEQFKLRKPFKIGDATILKKGDSYPAPWELMEAGADGVRSDELLRAYVNGCLPKKVRDMVHTGALCMAIPETDFMVTSGQEKGSPVAAVMNDHKGAPQASEDRDFGEGFSGDSEKT